MSDAASDSCGGTDPPVSSSNLNFWYDLYSGGKLDDFEDEWSLAASASNLEADWGYVFGSLPKDKKAKRRRKEENCGSSSNGCSTSDISEALSSISAALSLSSSDSDHRDGDTNGRRSTEKRERDEEMLDWLTSTASIPNSEDGDADGKMISFSDGYSLDHAAFEICGRTEQEKIQAVPQIGMEFFSEEEAYMFYKSYAEASGFRARKGKVQRAIDGTIRKRYIFCSRQGFRSRNQLTKVTKYKRKETRTGCNAQICCTAEEGKWVLTHCSLEHNHELLNQHRTMTRSSDGQGGTSIQQGSDINACNIQHEDSHSIRNWFGSLKTVDSSFSYEVMLDDKGFVSNVFWTGSTSKMNYHNHGEVLILETTSKTDRHGRIFTLLWGVNYQSRYFGELFGCALLVDESTSSFTWLFESFFKAMRPLPQRKQLKTIVTDEKQAVADAVKAVSPRLQHQVGMWHIRQSAFKNLSGLYENPGFKFLFEGCTSGSLTREEFASRWEILMERFVDLRENSWLNGLYQSKERWAYGSYEKNFWAGTQHNIISSGIFPSSGSNTMDLESIVRRYLRVARNRPRTFIGDRY